MLAPCSAGWQVRVVLWRQHNQPLWRKESFTPLNGNLSCQLRGFVDEVQGELQPICLGWENEGSGLCRQGYRQGQKKRAVCKQLTFGRHRWTGGSFKLKKKAELLKGQREIFNPSSLATLAGTWSRVQHSIFKCSCHHYTPVQFNTNAHYSITIHWEFVHCSFAFGHNDIILTFTSWTRPAQNTASCRWINSKINVFCGCRD